MANELLAAGSWLDPEIAGLFVTRNFWREQASIFLIGLSGNDGAARGSSE